MSLDSKSLNIFLNYIRFSLWLFDLVCFGKILVNNKWDKKIHEVDLFRICIYLRLIDGSGNPFNKYGSG